MKRVASFFLLGLIAFYRLVLSPITSFFGAKCRHEPVCSNYAAEAVTRYGPWTGAWMSLARALRCHPITALGGTSGVDNVPQAVTKPPFYAPWRAARWRGTNTE